MNRNRIVDAGGDPAFAQLCRNSLPMLDLDDVEMVDVRLFVKARRRRDTDLGESRVVSGGMPTARIIPGVEMA